jgi:hypothetical protein
MVVRGGAKHQKRFDKHLKQISASTRQQTVIFRNVYSNQGQGTRQNEDYKPSLNLHNFTLELIIGKKPRLTSLKRDDLLCNVQKSSGCFLPFLHA